MNVTIFHWSFLVGIVLFGLLSAQGQTIKVTLLGTGCPAPVMNRFGPSILIEAGDQKLIFDAGRGAIQRLAQVKVGFKDIQGVFLTHLHSDHVVGFPDLWLTGWLNGQRDKPLLLFGPRGTERMMKHLEQAFEFDIRIRLYDDRSSPEGFIVTAKDVTEGIVYEVNGVKVTVFDVDHRPTNPAFGYRVDYGGRSVVLSGDTRPSENLVKHAAGADVVVHEVVSRESLKQRQRGDEWIKMIISHHTTPEQAGEIFAKIKPKLAVYSHIVLPSATEQELIPPTRKMYPGQVILGEDLMIIDIGEKVTVRKARLD